MVSQRADAITRQPGDSFRGTVLQSELYFLFHQSRNKIVNSELRHSGFVGYQTDEMEQTVCNLPMGELRRGPVAQERKRIKHTPTFEELLAEEAIRFKEAAEKQPPGSTARELLLRRARQADTAAHISDWLRSPELQPPK